MLKIKAASKKILISVTVFSIILHFYLLTVSNYGVFISAKINAIFEHLNVWLNTLFMFILLLVTIIEFTKFVHYIKLNLNNTKNLKWMIKKDHLSFVCKLALLTLPFVALYLYNFFTAEGRELEYNIVVLVFASFSVLLAIALITLFFVYKFIIKIEWVENPELEVNFLMEQIYFSTIFLNVSNFDQSVCMNELNDEIEIFLTSKNIENDMNFNKKISSFLKETKKATTPPLI
ncbi:hypothetical protein [Spiroplasma endosymbiont of Diplazon laetatorius]|uniref:hypothetical protein n=1 Tax=Spiroplasma endosymbiont of Diplazon laetatorius TaxID=3066322 RepID=UPI0030CFE27D